MKLSNRSEYACLALIDLSESYGSGVRSIKQIAESRKIPRKFLEQILLALRNAGYVRSRKGPKGGYELAKPPAKISVAEIIRLMDGALAPVESVSKYYYEATPVEQSPRLIELLRSIRNYVADLLESTSFADLVE